jgi:HSP20 family molecular chaperone IbpA
MRAPPKIGIADPVKCEQRAFQKIYATDESLCVVMGMPGVEKKDIEVAPQNGVLRVDARIDFSKYDGMEPAYCEDNVGHCTQSFLLSNKIDRKKISAQIDDGVLTLTLPKARQAHCDRMR